MFAIMMFIVGFMCIGFTPAESNVFGVLIICAFFGFITAVIAVLITDNATAFFWGGIIGPALALTYMNMTNNSDR